jgi:beta-glucanase (GH16 family)
MRALIAVVVFVFAGCGPRNTTPVGPPDGWELAWADEFEGASGSPPSAEWWVMQTGTGPNGDGWGNGELQTYTNRPENVSLDGQGHLVITARRETLDGREYTSGRINTKGLFTQRYGRIEARARLPAGKGLWPAFWMLGADIDTVTWPACGEIDVLELRGDKPDTVYGSLHGPEYSAGGAISKKYTLAEGSFDEDFHTFAVQWDPGQITFWVDDALFQTVTAHTVMSGGRSWVYDGPFFLLLNVAVGGNFLTPSGQPDANTAFPQSMTVDWVRAYRRATVQ